MSRKAVKGYPEKSFYDNTIFEGISATGGPLNEGSFALITNFNITDGNRSLTPRDGYLTTTFKVDDEEVILSDKVLIYRDPNIQQNVIIDLSRASAGQPAIPSRFAYLVDITPYNVNTDDKKLFEGKLIENYDTTDITDFLNKQIKLARIDAGEELDPDERLAFRTLVRYLSIVGNPVLQPIVDRDGVTYYITKLCYKETTVNIIEFNFWVKILYREKGAKDLSDDTLVVSVVDTTQQTKRLKPRNLASPKSVIPSPLRTQEPINTTHPEPVDIGSVMLIQTPKGYVTDLIDEVFINQLGDITLHPSFYLKDPSKLINTDNTPEEKNKCHWAFRFDFINTSKDPKVQSRYKTPWRTLPVDKTMGGVCEAIEEISLLDKDLDSIADEYVYYIVPSSPEENGHFVKLDIDAPVDDEDEEVQPSHYLKEKHYEIMMFNYLRQNGARQILAETPQEHTGSGPLPAIGNTLGGGYSGGSYDHTNWGAMPPKDGEIPHIYAPDANPFDGDGSLQRPYNYRPGQLDPVGSLYSAYSLAKRLISEFPKDVSIEEVNTNRYEKEKYVFITQEEMESAMHLRYDAKISLASRREAGTDRTLKFTDAELNNAIAQAVGVDKTEIDSPCLFLDVEKFKNIKKLDIDSFKDHALEKGRTHRIKVVVLPYAYDHKVQFKDDPSNYAEEINMVHLICMMSVGGIYMSGMKADGEPDFVASPATWEQLKTLRVSEIVKTGNSLEHVNIDVFDDFSNLNLNDAEQKIPREVFNKGITISLYLKTYHEDELKKTKGMTLKELDTFNASWDATAYTIQIAEAVWAHERDVVYINETDIENPKAITSTTHSIVFKDRLVVWSGNKVYISEEGNYYFFSETMKHIFPEEVVKVIAFKEILLVFTTQNLYAIYETEAEVETNQQDEEGNKLTAIEIIWRKQCVLYNINPDRKYLDAIQVYNQMILFYSSEGQLYMIKPSATIDSETQFNIQYFNKSANQILENYDTYINARLQAYGKLDVDNPLDYVTKEQVDIKVLLDIDTIKIFYSVPNRITFILVYDVVNNRYITYDTLSFTETKDLWHAEGGEVYCTRAQGNTYITVPVKSKLGMDQNVDMHYNTVFKKEPIFTLLDTGNLNLNPHLSKRMRDLQVTLKNLDATKILYNAEVLLDDAIVRPMYSPDFKVKMVNGPSYTMTTTETPQEDIDELFGLDQTLGKAGSRTDLNTTELYQDKEFFDKNTILKTETINSSKIIEYNSSILSMGKNVRLKLQLISKGKYKLQSFGIIYKERHV